MIRKICIFLLALVMAMTLFTGCSDTVGEIAGNVADAAMEELEKQVKSVLEKNKVDVIEMKTVFGKLNDDGGKYQFFIGALVKSNATAVPQASADAMGKLFSEAGLNAQTGSRLENSHLVHKTITFKQADYSEGNYYVIWGYAADQSIELPDLSQLIETTVGK